MYPVSFVYNMPHILRGGINRFLIYIILPGTLHIMYDPCFLVQYSTAAYVLYGGMKSEIPGKHNYFKSHPHKELKKAGRNKHR